MSKMGIEYILSPDSMKEISACNMLSTVAVTQEVRPRVHWPVFMKLTAHHEDVSDTRGLR